MKAVVVGFGSIGARHARILEDLGCATTVVSARAVSHADVLPSLAQALADRQPGYVVIANATDRHLDSVLELARLGYAGTVLVEKPLFQRVAPLPQHLPFAGLFVAYNLRFHPLIRRLRQLLMGERVLSVNAYVGQYLPTWRPNDDYRRSYSAHASQGGGVLRDLSHELDYLEYLLGGWRRVCALGGHFSALEIDSDDVFGLMTEHERCPLVQIQLNYTDRLGRRRILVNTDAHTFEVDLVTGRLAIDREGESLTVDRNLTYRDMHRAALAGQVGELCSLAQAQDTLALIDAAERSAATRGWISH